MELKKHPMFKRKGADLFIERKITLYEALAGFKFQFVHLDGREVVISTPPGKIIHNGETMTVEELGMPFFGRNYKYGNLFIEFDVAFPLALSRGQIKSAKEALSSNEAEIPNENVDTEIYTPTIFEGNEKELLEQLKKRSKDMNDDDDEENGQGGQRVECLNQ